MSSRLQKLRDKLTEKELNAIFITQTENRRYLSGFHGTAGYLIITQKQAILATDFRYVEQAKSEAPGFQIHQITGNIKDWLPSLANDLGLKRMGFEGVDITYDFHLQLRRVLKNTKLISQKNLLEAIRAIKEPEEREFIARASAMTYAAFEDIELKIKAGMTEKQVAWELEKALRERGSESLPFEIIVGSGPNAALPHAKPTDRVIKESEPIVIDMGAKYRGYASDLTRTICVGSWGDKLKQVYNIVLEAQQTAIIKVRRGMTGKTADAIARNIISKAGYDDSFGHSLGHGVGLAAHEMPSLSPNSKEKLVDGMVFTIEPGIYLEGWGGVRIEDTVVMENGKARLMTKARKQTC